jgi:Vacuolar protein sorting-associated protein 62
MGTSLRDWRGVQRSAPYRELDRSDHESSPPTGKRGSNETHSSRSPGPLPLTSASAVNDHAALLRRFQPQLKYDSNEAFFAAAAAEWTDNPGNVLRRTSDHGHAGEPIAYASPQPSQAQLSLDFLGEETYSDGSTVESSDAITTPRRDYREMYVSLRMRGGFANRMYGRAQEDSRGRLWLQYWFYYFYNDYSLAGGIGLHEGDWEMIQLRIAPEGSRPDLAVYAQHVHGERASWDEVEMEPGQPDTPIVYVARGSHASYFHAGYHETEAWYDMADGKRRTPKLELEVIPDEVPGWLLWPGRWGVRTPASQASSSRAPTVRPRMRNGPVYG